MRESSENRRPSGRPSNGGKPQGIKAVDQALAVLKTIAAQPGPTTLMELARANGMEPSKLHRYLVSLCQSELVVKADAGLYDLGPGAIELGALALARLDDLACVDAMIGGIVQRLREIAFIYVWTRSGPVMIRSRATDYAPITLRAGTMAPMIGSASGAIFAAYLPHEVTRAIIARDAEAAGMDAEATERLLFEEIAPRVRRDGAYVSDVTLIPNNIACAGPVFNSQGDLIFVVGTSMRRTGATLTAEVLMAEISGGCAEISRRLGYRAEASR